MFPLFTAKRIVALTVALVIAYVWGNGPERFYYESTGTWIMFPVICVRLLPQPLSYWLLTSLTHFPPLDRLLCLVPILMLCFAAILAIQSLRKNSLACALVALALTSTVFSVYYFVQPMGITLVLY